MGALRGAVSYLRFQVEGDLPKKARERFERAIEARRFAPLPPDAELDESAGWAPIEDPFDDELAITGERFWFGDMIALAYREDRISIPRPLIAAAAKKKLAELEARGESINRQTRKTCELAALAELRRRVLPRPRCVDLVWVYEAHELRMFGRGPMATERAAAMFERTFDVRPRLAHYGTRAFEVDLPLRAKGVLEQVTPSLVFER